MHDFAELGKSIPAFLLKLWKLVDEPESDDLVCWSDTGQSFVILDTIRFTKDLLPVYFKHNNLASFIRQLNMYGFHKVVSVTSGLKTEQNVMEFSHTCFIRDHPYLMENIKRKIAATRLPVPLAQNTGKNAKDMTQAEILANVLADMSDLKSKQANWDQKLTAIKRENETLWRELAIFRQKHRKQEQIINRLIHFMVSVVRQPQRNAHAPVRRRYQLMINDSEEPSKPSTSSGPTIRELDPLEQYLNEPSTSKANSAHFILRDLENQDDEEERDVSYDVVSPGDVHTAQSATSPLWTQLSTDSEDPAMTPINPQDAIPDGSELNEPGDPVQQVDIKNPLKRAKPPTHNPSRRVLVSNNAKKPIKITQKKPEPAATTAPFVYRLINTPDGPRLEPDHNVVVPSTSAQKVTAPKPSSTRKQPKNNIRKVPKKNEAKVQVKEEILDDVLNLMDDNVNLDLLDDSHTNHVDTEASSFPLDSDSLAVAKQSNNFYPDHVASDLGQHVDQVQGDLDILKELLKNDSYNLDANTLLELFNDDPMSLVMPLSAEQNEAQESEGNELMAYNTPNFSDLADLYVATPMNELMGSSPPASPGLQTPIIAPASPVFPPAAKKRRK